MRRNIMPQASTIHHVRTPVFTPTSYISCHSMCRSRVISGRRNTPGALLGQAGSRTLSATWDHLEYLQFLRASDAQRNSHSSHTGHDRSAADRSRSGGLKTSPPRAPNAGSTPKCDGACERSRGPTSSDLDSGSDTSRARVVRTARPVYRA